MLKAKINKKGDLKVKRDGEFRSSFCPRQQVDDQGDDQECGEWCPLFGDVISNNWHEDGTFREIAIKTLTICEGATFEVVE